MADLSLTLDEIRKALAYEAGFGRKDTWAEYPSDQQAIITRAIASGLRMFYYPAIGYEWSFMKPVTTIALWPTTTATASATTSTTVSVASATFYDSMEGFSVVFDDTENEYPITSVDSSTQVTVTGDPSLETGDFTITPTGAYLLPSSFSGIEGNLHFDNSANSRKIAEARWVAESLVRKQWASQDNTGRPELFAIRPVVVASAVAQRHQMIVAPIPDQLYIASYITYQKPYAMDDSTPYPLGGHVFAETIQLACFAALESILTPDEGLRRAEFAQLLQASIMIDTKRKSPRSLGYNGDPGMGGRSGFWPSSNDDNYTVQDLPLSSY